MFSGAIARPWGGVCLQPHLEQSSCATGHMHVCAIVQPLVASKRQACRLVLCTMPILFLASFRQHARRVSQLGRRAEHSGTSQTGTMTRAE